MEEANDSQAVIDPVAHDPLGDGTHVEDIGVVATTVPSSDETPEGGLIDTNVNDASVDGPRDTIVVEEVEVQRTSDDVGATPRAVSDALLHEVAALLCVSGSYHAHRLNLCKIFMNGIAAY